MKAPIVEIFESIQGEGKSLGKPAIFVRFFGCTLFCRFKGECCDTPYAVSIDKDKSTMMTPFELAKKIYSFASYRVIFTGGEPTLYQDFIYEIISKLGEYDDKYIFEIETNGTIKIQNVLRNVIDQFNVSVKLKSSNQLNDEFDKKRINLDALESFPKEKSYFKFVVSEKNDINEVLELTKYNFKDIYLMPQGKDLNSIIKNSPIVVDLCIKYGFIFSPREHIIIWGGKKGV